MGRKKDHDYFAMLVEGVNYACEAATMLKTTFENFEPEKLQENINKVHHVEHTADMAKHDMMEKLVKEFITPIDREDIFVLYDNIDDLIDAIDEVSYKIYLRNYKSLPNNIELFINKSLDAVNYLKDVLASFKYIDDKKIMDPLLSKVIEIEEEVDKLYEENVHHLYLSELDYKVTTTYEKVYGYFEYITDKCRDVCKTISVIMYKNL